MSEGEHFVYESLVAADTVDFDRQMSALGWDLEFLSLEQEPAGLATAAALSPTIIVQRASCSGRLRQLGAAPKGFITIGLPSNCNDKFKFGNHYCQSNDLISFNTEMGLDAVTERGFEAYTISVHEDRLQQSLESQQIISTNVQEFRSKSLSAAQPRNHQTLQDDLASLLELAESNDLNRSTMDYVDIIDSFLEAWSNNDALARYSYVGSSQRRLRVTDYIHANLQKPLSIDSICRECSVGRRTLERDFRSHFGIGPKKYINLLRLSAVRGEIISTQGNLSISDLASKWGFNHMSKFASDYHLFFGELPSNTADSLR